MRSILALLALCGTAVAQWQVTSIAASIPIPGGKTAVGELTILRPDTTRQMPYNGPDYVEFNSPDLIFTLPCSAIADVRGAGFRDKWLSLGIRPASPFASQYAFLLHAEPVGVNAPPRLAALLPAQTSLEAGILFAKELQGSVADDQTHQLQYDQLNSTQPHAANRSADAPPHKAHILFQTPAAYLVKKPGAFITTEALKGGLVFSETGFAFEFASTDHLTAERRDAIKNGVFTVLNEDVANFEITNERGARGTNRPTILLHVRLRPDAASYTRYSALMTADHELILRLDWIDNSDRVREYFRKLLPADIR